MPSLSKEAIEHILQYVDKAGMCDMGVVVDIDGQSRQIRTPAPSCFFYGDYVVVEIETKEAPRGSKSKGFADEAAMAALNCSGAVIFVVLTLVGAAAEVPTFGLSTPLTVAGAVGTAGTWGACFNSGLRTYNALTDNGNNQQWDNIPVYKTAIQILDVASLIGVGATIGSTKVTLAILKRAGVSIKGAAKGSISRQGRKRFAREILESKKPGITNKEVKELLRRGAEPTRYTNSQISTKMVMTLTESFSAGLTVLSSAIDGNIKNLIVSVAHLEIN